MELFELGFETSLTANDARTLTIKEERKIRVLSLGSPIGLYGAERWILALLRHLPGESVEPFVGVIIDEPGMGEPALCQKAHKLGFSTVQFESHGKLSLSAIRQLRKFIRDNGIDILHTHGYKTDIIGMLAARGTECRTISTPHGWSTKAGWKLQLYEILDRVVFLFLDAVVPLSPDIYDGLHAFSPMRRKLHLIRNGVDLSEVDSATMQLTNTPGALDSDTFLVGYIGQLIQRKGIDVLIRAFDDLDVADRQLWIIGEGEDRERLEHQARNSRASGNIHFLGYREDRLALLKRFSAFVLPSSLEGIPRCLLEAMAAQVPVVTTNIPGSRELVVTGKTGILFEPGDAEALTNALTELASDGALCRSLALEAEGLVRQRYSAATMSRNYLTLYETVLN